MGLVIWWNLNILRDTLEGGGRQQFPREVLASGSFAVGHDVLSHPQGGVQSTLYSIVLAL